MKWKKISALQKKTEFTVNGTNITLILTIVKIEPFNLFWDLIPTVLPLCIFLYFVCIFPNLDSMPTYMVPWVHSFVHSWPLYSIYTVWCWDQIILDKNIPQYNSPVRCKYYYSYSTVHNYLDEGELLWGCVYSSQKHYLKLIM